MARSLHILVVVAVLFSVGRERVVEGSTAAVVASVEIVCLATNNNNHIAITFKRQIFEANF